MTHRRRCVRRDNGKVFIKGRSFDAVEFSAAGKDLSRKSVEVKVAFSRLRRGLTIGAAAFTALTVPTRNSYWIYRVIRRANPKSRGNYGFAGRSVENAAAVRCRNCEISNGLHSTRNKAHFRQKDRVPGQIDHLRLGRDDHIRDITEIADTALLINKVWLGRGEAPVPSMRLTFFSATTVESKWIIGATSFDALCTSPTLRFTDTNSSTAGKRFSENPDRS
jgi:hypothetical protein